MNLTLTPAELNLLDDILSREHMKKLEALETSKRFLPRHNFTARDFGIPVIETLINKLEALQ